MSINIPPVGPGCPPGLAPLLTAMRDAVLELAQPTYPHPAFTTVKANLPPAANFTNCPVVVADLDTLAVSDGVQWLRVDTGDPV